MRASYRELLIRLRSLLASGVPIREALETIAEGSRPDSLAALLLRSIDSGQSLGDALAARPDAVPPEHAALVRAGEESGRLPEILQGMLDDLEALRSMKRSLLQQAVYPLACVSLVLLLPPFGMYFGAGVWMEGSALYLALFVALGLAVLLVWKGPGLIPRSSGLRLRLERLVLSIPILRGLVADALMGRALWLEALLLEAGLSLDSSLPLVGAAVGWEHVAREIEEAREDIRGGLSATESFRRLAELPAALVERLASAEKAGRLQGALRDAGSELRERFLHRLQVTFRVLPVFLYLLAGLIILRMALAVFQRGAV